VLLALALLSGCTGQDESDSTNPGGPPSDMPQMWVDEFTRLKNAHPDNEWLQAVLADWEITLAEAREGMTRFEDCMEDKDWLRPQADIGMTTTARQGQAQPPWNTPEFDALQAEFDVDMRACERLWMEPAWLRFSMDRNPAGEDPWQVVLDCMNRYQVPDLAGLTLEEFARVQTDHWYLLSATPQAELCSMDPTGEFGITMEEVYQRACHGYGNRQHCTFDEAADDMVCEPAPPSAWCP
jgi:hypothetical protein